MKNTEQKSISAELYELLKSRQLVGSVAEKANVFRHTVRRVMNSSKETPTKTRVMKAANEVLLENSQEVNQVRQEAKELLMQVASN